MTATVTLQRLGREWRLKLGLSFLLPVVFCVPYFALQQLVAANARMLPVSFIDRAVAFDPRWVWVYQSTYLLLPIFPWLASRRSELKRYLLGYLALCLVGFLCFALFPVSCPRPVDAPDQGMYGLLLSYDGTGNSFPSLHVGLAVYSLCFGASVLGSQLDPAARRLVYGVATVWIMAIAYSTLATKQHYFVDLPAGAAVAAGCHWWFSTRTGLRASVLEQKSLERDLPCP